MAIDHVWLIEKFIYTFDHADGQLESYYVANYCLLYTTITTHNPKEQCYYASSQWSSREE